MPFSAEKRLTILIEERRSDPRFDEELWRFVDKRTLNLRNLDAGTLAERSITISSAMLWLLGSERDREPIEAGYWSSWWWLRCWIQTEAELERRKLNRPTPQDVEAAPPVHPSCIPVRASVARIWSRIGERQHLLSTLREGRIRFGPAADYDKAALNLAQRDDELRRHRIRPSQALIMTTQDGRPITPLGDVRFTTTASPYWISSWSCEFDPRLFDAFGAGNPAIDSYIVVWRPEEFAGRIAAVVQRDMADWLFASMPIQYEDPYALLSGAKYPVSMTKDFSFAYQRELRLGLVLPSPIKSVGDAAIFLTAGSLEDIAGVYDPQGCRVAGTGPTRIFGKKSLKLLS
jgi:hypothetical protein